VCEGDVEGHISTRAFAIQANPIIEFSPDVLQNFQMAAHELVHCPTAMLGHDEHVEARRCTRYANSANTLKPAGAPDTPTLRRRSRGRRSPEISKRWSIESVEEVDQLQAFAVSSQTCMPEREVYFGTVG
jgi:hypothetical protein